MSEFDVSGIRPLDRPGFVAAEIAGAFCAVAAIGWLFRPAAKPIRATQG